jgi:hypothetical protein
MMQSSREQQKRDDDDDDGRRQRGKAGISLFKVVSFFLSFFFYVI